MTMQIRTVRCKKCSFTTTNSQQELDHVVVESIRQLQGSPRIKKIAIVMYERTHLNAEEFKILFDEIMELMGYTEKFTIIDCMQMMDAAVI